MGLFDFVRDAGDAIFGGNKEEEAAARDLDAVLADKKAAASMSELVGNMGFKVDEFGVKFREGKATLTGKVASSAEREKIILMIGNTHGVAQVEDQMVLTAAAGAPGPEASAEETTSTMYTVQSGDSLSKIAKAHYGDAMKYTVIFEANTPMLKDPNKIYPGQVLRIPPLEG